MMNREKRKAIFPAVLLFGVLAALMAVTDSPALWPPDVVWASLSNPHRFQFCGGIAVIVVAIVMFLVTRKKAA